MNVLIAKDKRICNGTNTGIVAANIVRNASFLVLLRTKIAKYKRTKS
jgi:hypothetical protein